MPDDELQTLSDEEIDAAEPEDGVFMAPTEAAEEDKSLDDAILKHLEGQHDQSTHAGDRAGGEGSESMVVEPTEQGKQEEQRYKEGMESWERHSANKNREDGNYDWSARTPV